MTSFLRSIGPTSIVALTVAFASPAAATDTRDMANPERMTEPATPGARPPAIPGERKMTRPEAATPGTPSAQPRPEHPDEGYHATVEEPAAREHPPLPTDGAQRDEPVQAAGDDAAPTPQPPMPANDVQADAPLQAAEQGAAPAAKPEIDPSVAAEEKPGADRELAAGRDAEDVAALSAHERGLSNVMSDIFTSARVKISLALDSRTPAMDINVDTTDGRVTLFGIVPTEEAKFAAGADALSIAGVKAVDNTLQVVAEDRKPDVLARDEKIQETLERRLEPYPSMQDVWIDVKNCVARLRGEVKPGKEREEAMLAVRKTPGVCQVKDELKFAAS